MNTFIPFESAGKAMRWASMPIAACVLMTAPVQAGPAFSSKAEAGVRLNAAAGSQQTAKPSKAPKCLEKGSEVVFPVSASKGSMRCAVKCDGRMVSASAKPAGKGTACVVMAEPKGARSCSVALLQNGKPVGGAKLPGCKSADRSLSIGGKPAEKPNTGLRSAIGKRTGPVFDRSRLGPPVNQPGSGGGGQACRNPAVINVNIRPHGGPAGNQGFIVTGTIQNIGNADYRSGPNQQLMMISHGSRSVQSQPFGNMTAGGPTQSIGYVFNSYDPASSNNHDWTVRISYDPDILMDSNPENDDCNRSDNVRVVPASEIRRIMAAAGNG